MFREILIFGLGVSAFGLKIAYRLTGNFGYMVAALACLMGVYHLGVRHWSQGTIVAMLFATVAGASLPDDVVILFLGVAS